MKKLYRSRTDSKLFGLCGGLAEWLNIDATLLRLVVIITAVFSGGTVIPIYFIASLVVPKEPFIDENRFSSTIPSGMSYASSNMGKDGGVKNASKIDEMMKDIEKKAMQKEIEQLRAKLSNYEKGDL